jgi:hypothetical protein
VTTRPLGKRQRELLLTLASPSRVMIVGDALTASLVRRGLLAARDNGDWCRITPAGMRALADEYEAGRLDEFFTKELTGE